MGRMNICNNSYAFGSGKKSLSGSNRSLSVCRLNVVWEGYCQKSMNHFVVEAKAASACLCLRDLQFSWSSMDVTLDLSGIKF